MCEENKRFIIIIIIIKLQIEDIKNTTLFHLAYTPCVQYSLAKKVIINKNLAQTSNAQWKQKRFCFVLFVVWCYWSWLLW